MPLDNLDQIRQGQPFPPHSELAMTNYTAKWRRYYENDFAEAHIEKIAEDLPGYGINWYRRIATFYGEFMFGDRPQIFLERIDDRMQEELETLGESLFPALQVSNVDMIRYGKGVIASHPHNPLAFQRFERDQHFEVHNQRGETTADILYRVRNQDLPDEERSGQSKRVDVYKYPVNGPAIWEIYSYTKGALGNRLETINLAPRQGRQVIEFSPNIDTTSLFEDIEGPINEMSRTLSRVGFSVKRNLRPHLAAPTGSLVTEDGKTVAINEKGMVFPVESGDILPQYIQWDSSMEGVQVYLNNLKSTMFNMVGLSELLFDPALFPGELSGEALRRLMMAFWSKLNHFKAINNQAIEQLLDMWNLNRQANGLEVFDIGAIEVLWKWEDLFMNMLDSDNEQETQSIQE